MQCLQGLRQHRLVVPPGRVHGSQGQQDAALRVVEDVGVGGSGQLAGHGDVLLADRLPTLVERDQAAHQGHHERDGDADQLQPEPAVGPGLAADHVDLLGPLGIPREPARVHVLVLERRQCGSPTSDFECRLERGAPQQGRRVSAELRPGGGRLADPPEHDQLVAVVLDPLPQSGPVPDQRLVGNLDGRHSCLWVNVEGEESRGGPAVNDLRRALQLLAGGSAPGRLTLGGHHDEALEELAHLSSVCVVERQVELLGSRRDRPLDPAQRTVGGERQRPVRAVLGELEEDELQRRQRGRLGRESGDQLGGQGALDAAVGAPRRLDHGRLDLGREHRGDGHGGVLDERPEGLDRQRAVVVVGPQRRHHPKPAVGDGQRVRDPLQERPLLRLRRQGEQLLELVDQQQQLTTLGDDASQGAVDPLDPSELRGETGGVAHRDRAQALRQLLVRRSAGQHGRDEPALRPGSPAGAQPRKQAGPDRTRLAGAGRPDQQHQPAAQPRARQPGRHLVDQRGAAEVVLGVRLVERPQAPIGVASAGRRVRVRAERGQQRRGQLLDRHPVR